MIWHSLGLSRGLRQDNASVVGTLCFLEGNVLASPGNISLEHPLGSFFAFSSWGLFVPWRILTEVSCVCVTTLVILQCDLHWRFWVSFVVECTVKLPKRNLALISSVHYSMRFFRWKKERLKYTSDMLKISILSYLVKTIDSRDSICGDSKPRSVTPCTVPGIVLNLSLPQFPRLKLEKGLYLLHS